MMTTLVIQIPAYNEVETLPETLADLPGKIAGIDRIYTLVIDDGSSDETAQAALDSGADDVIRHANNCGLSRAFMSGISRALELGADIIVNTDADHQYPGRYIAALVRPILDGEADVVIGDRQANENEHFSPLKRILALWGSRVTSWVAGVWSPDAASGFRAYSCRAALRLKVRSSFSYTLETLIQAGREGLLVKYIPIQTNATLRKSRLHKGMADFLIRQGITLVHSFFLYPPRRLFGIAGIPVIVTALFFFFRFLNSARDP